MVGLLVAGTNSDAGKSAVVAGLCRWLARQGVAVAPFKSQNMSLNSYVTRDGAEIGRAQAAQAWAAGLEPEAAMNPVLLKPGSDLRSQLIVMGRAVGERAATEHWDGRGALLDVVVDAYRSLAGRFDVVICEGAGSPAEINLRAGDIANLGFARAVSLPVLLVGDIDRGGVFASLVGTLAVLDAEDQSLIRAFLINKFRGDRALLEPGLRQLEDMTGRPTVGVLPFIRDLGVDAEDAISPALLTSAGPPLGDDVLRVTAVAFPRLSNHTDLDALAVEPGVVVRFTTEPAEALDADLLVLPGTRATVDDLRWLRDRGFGEVIARRAARGLPVLGICGGYQMLGTHIDDIVESRAGRVPGLGLLPARTRFGAEKVLARPQALGPDGSPLSGYEIHHGVVTVDGGEPFAGPDDCRVGAVAGTLWHGLFENDAFRRGYLAEVAGATGRRFRAAPDTSFTAVRDRRFDLLADLIAEHADTDALHRMLEGHSPPPSTLQLRRR